MTCNDGGGGRQVLTKGREDFTVVDLVRLSEAGGAHDAALSGSAARVERQAAQGGSGRRECRGRRRPRPLAPPRFFVATILGYTRGHGRLQRVPVR